VFADGVAAVAGLGLQYRQRGIGEHGVVYIGMGTGSVGLGVHSMCLMFCHASASNAMWAVAGTGLVGDIQLLASVHL
jgi:hypothetical protein